MQEENNAMMAMAAKLRSAIGTAPLGTARGTTTAISSAGAISVVNGAISGNTTSAALKENKMAMIAPLHVDGLRTHCNGTRRNQRVS